MNTEHVYTVGWSGAWIALIIAILLPFVIMGGSVYFAGRMITERIETIAQDAEKEIARLEQKFDGIIVDVEKELEPVTQAIDTVSKDVARVEKSIDGVIADAEKELSVAEDAVKGFVHDLNLELTKAEAHGQLLATVASYAISQDTQAVSNEVTQAVNQLDAVYTQANSDAQKEWTSLKAEYDQVVTAIESDPDAAIKQLEALVESSLKTEGKAVTKYIDSLAKEIGIDEKEIDQAVDSIVNSVEVDLRKLEAGGRLAMMLASDAANNDMKAVAQEVNQVISELDSLYASANEDAQKEWTTIKAELTTVAQSLDNEAEGAVETATKTVNQYLTKHPETLDVIIGVVLTDLGIRSPEIQKVVTEIVNEIAQGMGTSMSS